MELADVKIVTDRLILQRMEPKYAREIMAEFTDEITQYMFPKPPNSIDDVMQFITSSMNGTEAGSNLQLVVLKKLTEEFIGCVGLHHIGQKDPELGLWIKKSGHGNKYGLEAITNLIAWAKENIKYEYLRYPVDKRNYPSRRIPEQNGGVIKREMKNLNQKGFELDEVEYWIYR